MDKPKLRQRPRQPSVVESLGSTFEDLVLVKADLFLFNLELRLAELEEFGWQELESFDDNVRAAYDSLVHVRDRVLGEGRKRAGKLSEKLLRGLQTGTFDLGMDRLGAPQALKMLEDKLALLEKSCFEVVDGSMAVGLEAALRAAQTRLLTYDELPVPWRENPYILRGYRLCKSYSACAWGLFTLHNETTNIWTHLLGFFAILALSLYHFPQTFGWDQLSAMDRLTLVVFLGAAMKCLLCSVIWHLFSGISRLNHKQRFACVDYSGITVLILASVLSTQYTALYCHTASRNSYMAVTALVGGLGVRMTWDPSFDTKENRPKRVAFFVGLSCVGLAAFVHASCIYGLMHTLAFYSPIIKSIMCYSAGVVVYALLIPERFCPGHIFDYVGMSHNLWHLAVFGGIYYHYEALDAMFKARTVC